jgi:hypothetical protein
MHLFGLSLSHGLLAALAGVLGLLNVQLRRLTRHIPAGVAKLLAHAPHQQALLQIILDLSSYANLTPAQRRTLALQFVRKWLDDHHVPLSDHELSLLVELLYSFAKQQHPEAIAPAPVEIGAPGKPQ